MASSLSSLVNNLLEGHHRIKFNLNMTMKNVKHVELNISIATFFLNIRILNMISHPALRRPGGVTTTSLCTSQWRRRYVPNETPNNVSMQRHEDVSVARLHDVLLQSRNDVSKGRNNDVPSVRFRDVSNKSQMKHPTTSQWYVTKMSQWYESTTSH